MLNSNVSKLALACATGLALALAGCADDGAKTNFDDPDAAAGGSSAAGAGGASSGGAVGGGGRVATGGSTSSGGSTSGGAASGGDTGAGGTGAGGDTGAGGSMSDAGSEADASDAAIPVEGGTFAGLFLVGSTDFFSGTEVAAIDLATRTVTARTTVADGDTGIIASGGRGFLLQRTLARLTTLTAIGAEDRVIDLGQADGGAGLNPHDVVVVRGAAGAADRAFVPMHDANRVDVFDLDTGARVRSVDLSFLLEAGDTDGSVDVDVGVYVPSEGRVYFVVQRIDRNTITLATNFTVLCPAWPSLVIALDAATGDVAQLGDSAANPGIPLGLVSPADIELDAAGGRLVVTSSGCAMDLGDAGVGARTLQGIELVTLSTGTAAVAFAPGTGDYFSGTDLLEGTRVLVSSFDAFYSSVYSLWSIGSATLDAPLSGVPEAPQVFDGGALLGLRTAAPPAVVAYSTSTGATEVILTSPWEGSFTLVAGAALVR